MPPDIRSFFGGGPPKPATTGPAKEGPVSSPPISMSLSFHAIVSLFIDKVLSQNNPDTIFSDAGFYRVLLRKRGSVRSPQLTEKLEEKTDGSRRKESGSR
jgi:hypothetical protein